jgi:hypothetical protein
MPRATKLDRAAIMRRAHRDYRWWRAHGEPRTFGQCLSTAWAAARIARDSGLMKYRRAA